MVRINIRSIAFGCLVKPLPAAFGAQFVYAGGIARNEFDSSFADLSFSRLWSRGLMEGPVDGNATFSASRYRCY